MTLQQLEYVLAVSEYGHFGKAARACNITQSTLSTLIQKLEMELDLTIFDRSQHPVLPTEAGKDIIQQAKVVLFNANQLTEMAKNEKQQEEGVINLGISPTIAPYLVPKLFKFINDNYPRIRLQAYELFREQVVEELMHTELDMAIMAMPHKVDDLLEIPLFHERMLAYVSPLCPEHENDAIRLYEMPDSSHLWCLKEETRLLPQVAELEYHVPPRTSHYESGNLATLVRIVQETGGMTVVPQLYTIGMREEFMRNLRPLIDPVPIRDVSLFIRKDYVRERFVNIIIDAIKANVPAELVDSRISKYVIRL